MVLKYSLALELLRPTAGGDAPTPGTLWPRVVELLHDSLNVRDRLPARAAMLDLLRSPSEDLRGNGELDLHWALEGPPGAPSCWAMSILHPGADDERFLWCVDLAARQLLGSQSGVRLGIRLSVESLDGKLAPTRQRVSRPRIVRQILRDWHVAKEGIPMRRWFEPWRSLPRLAGLLANTDRQVPIIILGPAARDRTDRRPRILRRLDPLALHLSGCAVLAWLPDESQFEQFHRSVDRSLALPDEHHGAVYWPLEPGMRAAEIRSEKCEPFLLPSSRQDCDALTERLVDRMAQCLVVTDPGAISTVPRLRRHQDEVKAREADAKIQDIPCTREQYEELTFDLADKEEQLRALREEYGRLSRDIATERRSRAQSLRADHSWGDWTPENAEVAVQIAEAAPHFRERLIISSSAHKGAKKSPFKQPEKVLAALAFLGTEFLEHIRQQKPNLEGFAAQAGYDIALTETGVTRSNKEWMAERDVHVDGKAVRCESHLKIGRGSPEECLRIYFKILNAEENSAIVIGHVGEHLTTRQTASR